MKVFSKSDKAENGNISPLVAASYPLEDIFTTDRSF
jgi:hypothetical protein